MKRARYDALRIARELCYDRWMPDIYERIRAARTESEIQRVLISARKEWNKNE